MGRLFRQALRLLCVTSLFAAGCHDAGDGGPEADASGTGSADGVGADDVSADASQEDTTTGEDGTGAPDTGPVETGPMTRLTVIDDLLFTTSDGGIAPGYDLDGKVSDGQDESTCYNADFTSAEGVEGVDNKLATLVPFFEAFGIGAAQGLIQDAIETGGILLVVEASGVDDPLNDDDITLTLRAATGVPLLGTDGKLLPGQTFSLHEESPDSTGPGRIENGRLYAGPLEVSIPIVVFGLRYDLTFLDARIEATWTEDGSLKDGMLGGAVRIADLIKVGEVAAQDDPSVLTAIEGLLGSAGDLAPDEDGVCQQLSGTFLFSAVSAFLYDTP